MILESRNHVCFNDMGMKFLSKEAEMMSDISEFFKSTLIIFFSLVFTLVPIKLEI